MVVILHTAHKIWPIIIFIYISMANQKLCISILSHNIYRNIFLCQHHFYGVMHHAPQFRGKMLNLSHTDTVTGNTREPKIQIEIITRPHHYPAFQQCVRTPTIFASLVFFSQPHSQYNMVCLYGISRGGNVRIGPWDHWPKKFVKSSENTSSCHEQERQRTTGNE